MTSSKLAGMPSSFTDWVKRYLDKARILGSPTQVLLLLVVGLVLLRPLALIVWGATRSATPGTPGAHYTLEAFRNTFTSPFFWQATLNSLVISTIVTVLAIAIGVGLTWLLVRTNMPGRNLLRLAALSSIFYSSLIGIIGWEILLAGRSGIINNLWRAITGSDGNLFEIYGYAGVVFVMVIHFIPYVILVTSGSIQSMDSSLEEAAIVSGSSRWRTFRKISLPVMLPTISAAALVVFVLAMEVFSIPLILGSRDRIITLASWVYLNVRGLRPDVPSATIAGLVLLLIVLVGLYAYRRVTRRAGRYVTVGGRGFSVAPVDLGRFRIPVFIACVLFVFVTTVLPVIGVVIRALMQFRTSSFSMEIFGWQHFVRLFGEASFTESLRNTLLLSTVGGAICVAIGLPVAYWKNRHRTPAAIGLDYLLTIPLTVPGILLGLGFLWAFVASPLYATLGILLLVLVTRYVGIGVQSIAAGVVQMDRSLEEAAFVSGAGEMRTVRTISLPLLKSVMLSAWLLTFLTIARELSSSVLLYGVGSRTLPILTWEFLQDGVFGPAAALAVVQIVVMGAVVFGLAFTFKLDLTGGSGRRPI